MTSITLPGRQFATAWLNVSLASGADDGAPALFRTVYVEMFDDAVQLVATDTFLLLTSAVAVDDDTDLLPELDEAPELAATAIDYDGRMRALMTWLHKDAVRAEKNDHPGPEVTLTVKTAEPDPMAPATLGTEVDRKVLVVQTLRERLTLDIYEGSFPHWRNVFKDRPKTGVAVPAISFSAENLARLGKTKDAVSQALEMTFAGDPMKPVGLLVRCDPVLQGVVIPVRAL